MRLITKEQAAQMRANALVDGDHEPVVKLFNPTGAATWLLSELHEDGDTMFGLCDLGFGEPELGYVSLGELETVRGRFGLGVERDLYWKPTKTLAQYAVEARTAGRIVA